MTTLESKRSRNGGMILRGLILLITPVTLIALLTGTASASDNAGDPTLGTPPCDTQSASEHLPITMTDPNNGENMGTAYLVYSAGCQTEWVTVHANSPYEADPSIWLQNQTGTNLYQPPTSPDGGTYWTYQLGNMKYQTACGGVQMYDDLTGAWVSWNYIGCY
jgi:hypothetical protein